MRTATLSIQTSINFKFAFSVGLFESLLAENCSISLCNCSSFTSSL